MTRLTHLGVRVSSFKISFTLTILVSLRAVIQVCGGQTVSAENCIVTRELKPDAPFTFTSPTDGKGQYLPGLHCNWTLVSSICKPSISCELMDLRQTPHCTKDYLEIYDGLGGYERFCGREEVKQLHPSAPGGTYLFVNLVTSRDTAFSRRHSGIKCEVSCHKGTKALKVPEAPISEDPTCVCGMQKEQRGNRIVGGVTAKKREFPWLVAIVLTGTRGPICGGSVINNRWVLCAAHCFRIENIGANDVEVLANAYILNSTFMATAADVPLGQEGSARGPGYNLKHLTDKEEGSLRRKVKRVITHPLYTPGFDYDVALLELETEFNFHDSDASTPVCLPDAQELTHTYETAKPWVAGWGLAAENAGATTRILQKLEVPIISHKKCSEYFPTELTPRMLCAGFEEGIKDSCTGDSGGPLALQNKVNKQWTQIGIVSWGEGCAKSRKPGVYSRVTESVPWIQANAQGGTWCSRKSKIMF